MQVAELDLEGFTNHLRTKVKLPPSGLVLVTGLNGSGKSSLLEAVSWACWGRTLRSTPPAHAEGSRACVVRVDGGEGGYKVERARKGAKGRATLTWSAPGDPPGTYETATKAQEALEASIGTWEQWRRTSVFTSTDAWGFAEATDAQRKLLLEALLGLGCFDLALDALRKDLKAERGALTLASRDLAVAEEGARQVSATLEALGQVAPEPSSLDVGKIAARVERLEGMLAEVGRETDAARARGQLATMRYKVAEASVEAAKNRVKATQAKPVCPTCNTPLTPERTSALASEVDAEAASFRRVNDETASESSEARAALAELQSDADALRRQINDAHQAVRAAREAQQRAERWGKQHTEAQQRAQGARERVATLKQQHDLIAHRVDVLEKSEVVLGLKGVRSQVLGGALEALEVSANVWLARLRPDLAVSLDMTDDKVALGIRGAGGGHGFLGASAGERRHVALALMLALAGIAQASAQSARGVLWFDEVFDVLDDNGVRAVCDALDAMASERPVVVITHSPSVEAHLHARLWLHAEGGAVKVSRTSRE